MSLDTEDFTLDMIIWLKVLFLTIAAFCGGKLSDTSKDGE